MEEPTLMETLQLEMEYEEKKYEFAQWHRPIEEIIIIQKQIEYPKITMEAIQDRYHSEDMVTLV